jgi:hypothetical protein
MLAIRVRDALAQEVEDGQEGLRHLGPVAGQIDRPGASVVAVVPVQAGEHLGADMAVLAHRLVAVDLDQPGEPSVDHLRHGSDPLAHMVVGADHEDRAVVARRHHLGVGGEPALAAASDDLEYHIDEISGIGRDRRLVPADEQVPRQLQPLDGGIGGVGHQAQRALGIAEDGGSGAQGRTLAGSGIAQHRHHGPLLVGEGADRCAIGRSHRHEQLRRAGSQQLQGSGDGVWLPP